MTTVVYASMALLALSFPYKKIWQVNGDHFEPNYLTQVYADCAAAEDSLSFDILLAVSVQP